MKNDISMQFTHFISMNILLYAKKGSVKNCIIGF
jgi:hypothetical protein